MATIMKAPQRELHHRISEIFASIDLQADSFPRLGTQERAAVASVATSSRNDEGVIA
jgi:hypothetical protein